MAQRAQDLTQDGVLFPWRTINGEECSAYWPAGVAAFHINADIADAVAGASEDLGFLVGLGGPVTWERALRLRRLAATMPLQFLLLETDAPDQPDAAIRGQRNEPVRLPEIVRLMNSAGFGDKMVTPDVGLFISRVDAGIASRMKKAQASTRNPSRSPVSLDS